MNREFQYWRDFIIRNGKFVFVNNDYPYHFRYWEIRTENYAYRVRHVFFLENIPSYHPVSRWVWEKNACVNRVHR